MDIEQICRISSNSLAVGISHLSTHPTQRRTTTRVTALIRSLHSFRSSIRALRSPTRAENPHIQIEPSSSLFSQIQRLAHIIHTNSQTAVYLDIGGCLGRRPRFSRSVHRHQKCDNSQNSSRVWRTIANTENCLLASMTIFHSDLVLCSGGSVGYGFATPLPGEHGALVPLCRRANSVYRVFARVNSGDRSLFLCESVIWEGGSHRSQICVPELWFFFALFVSHKSSVQSVDDILLLES
jgi:hypothetical protein